jgi:galactokinase
MNNSHISLRDNYELVTTELNSMVTVVWKIDGVVLGSRTTGGGFGGCTVSLVREEVIDTFIEKAGSIYDAKTGIKPQFYVAEIDDYACKLN